MRMIRSPLKEPGTHNSIIVMNSIIMYKIRMIIHNTVDDIDGIVADTIDSIDHQSVTIDVV